MGSCWVRRERKGWHGRRRASSSPPLAGAVLFLWSLPITFLHGKQQEFLPSPLETCIMGTPITNGCYPRCSKGTLPMSEPTQDLIVSELRRRVRVSMAELTQVLGVQFASVLPQEIQRMKDSGLVVYDEPLGPYSVLSLPQ